MVLSASGRETRVSMFLVNRSIVAEPFNQNQNHWQWAKLLEAGKEESICFTYRRDRLAVAFPRFGVKVWLWIKGLCLSQVSKCIVRSVTGTWRPQRSILRQNVTCIKFVEDGDALLGGTSDGVL